MVTITPGIKVMAEYDDNINLENDTDTPAKDDLIVHTNPTLEVALPYKDHVFSLSLGADYRKGTMHDDISDLNMYATGDMQFSFPGGLNMGLRNQFEETRFDNALYEEPGVSKTRSNLTSLSSDYTWGERMKVEGIYGHLYKRIEDQDQVTDRQNNDSIRGTIHVPVATNIVHYIKGFYERQKSDLLDHHSYDDRGYLFGLKLEGPYRFSIWGEIGYEEVDYKLGIMEDYKDAIWGTGVEILFTELTTGKVRIGQDVYSNVEFNVDLNHQFRESTIMSVNLSRSTQPSYSTSYPGGALKTDSAQLNLTQRILEKWTLKIDGGYRIQRSFSDNIYWKYRVYLGKIGLEYLIQEWMTTGFYYQYAQREADRSTDDYTNNRVGAFISFIF